MSFNKVRETYLIGGVAIVLVVWYFFRKK